MPRDRTVIWVKREVCSRGCSVAGIRPCPNSAGHVGVGMRPLKHCQTKKRKEKRHVLYKLSSGSAAPTPVSRRRQLLLYDRHVAPFGIFYRQLTTH
jgi:hypothetical protein